MQAIWFQQNHNTGMDLKGTVTIYAVKMLRTRKQFFSLCALYQHITQKDINRTSLSTTLNTILFAIGYITQQQ